MRIRENLGTIVAATSPNRKTSNASPSNKPQIGKVYGVITTENTPTKELFEKYGGWAGIGTVFYLDYEQSKNLIVTDLSQCKPAKPIHASNQNYPLVGELVYLVDAPSPISQGSNNNNTEKYYTGTINLWNNNQQNAPGEGSLGKTFNENADIRPLISFEGDRIYQGRKGNGIRFGSTVKSRANLNEWSSIGNDGDPITILVNGYVTTDKKSLKPNVEEINKELSSLWMTSTQKIPLQPGALIKNPVFSSTEPNNYINPQIILNSDRIVLNTKKDDIILNSSGFIELSTDSIINLNSAGWIHLNIESNNRDSKILLCTQVNKTFPDNPILLGRETTEILSDILQSLKNLAFYLASSISVTEGSAIPSVNDAGEQLFSEVIRLQTKLQKFDHLSKKIFAI
jgi:hypothetical protein